MNSEILKVFRKFVFRERIETYKKLLIFGFFLIVSTTFWFVEALDKEYTTTIYFPVTYTNFPGNKIFTGKLTRNLILKVKSSGFQLFKYNIFYNEPLVFNLELFLSKRFKKNSSLTEYYLTKDLKDNISNRIGDHMDIKEIFPDSLIFKFEDIVNKTVAVKPVVDLKFDKQFTLKGEIITKPESIYISGINSSIDTINYIKTEKKKLSGINHPVLFTIPLSKVKGVNYSHQEVRVSVDVEKYTESFVEVPIRVINVPQNIKFKIFPEKATVSFFVGLSEYRNIHQSDFHLLVDYDKIKSNVGTKINVQILSVPKSVFSVKIKPNFVNYLIKI